jgi:hypothetical protein
MSLVFSDLVVNVLGTGYAPFVVPGGEPEFKTPHPVGRPLVSSYSSEPVDHDATASEPHPVRSRAGRA